MVLIPRNRPTETRAELLEERLQALVSGGRSVNWKIQAQDRDGGRVVVGVGVGGR